MRAVVPGGGTGLGKAIAGRLSKDGMDVVIVGRRRSALEAAATDIGSDRLTLEVCDVEDPTAVVELAARLGTGPLVDVLANNAGAPPHCRATRRRTWPPVGVATSRTTSLTTVLLTEALLPHIARPGAASWR